MLQELKTKSGVPATTSGRYRWVVCGLLFFATTVNYMDRQILSLLKPILDGQLHWSNEQFGEVNSAFQGAYAIGGLIFGYLVDRLGTKIGYAISITGWSLAAMGHALVTSIGGFFVARMCLGISEAGNFPSSIKTVALWFPKKERTLATSLFNSGSNFGPIIAPIVIPWIALTWGWQTAFIVAGLAGLIWLAFWLPLYQVPERQKRLSADELAYIQSDRDESHDEGAGKIPWLRLFRFRQAWSIIVGRFMTDPVWWFFLIWLPDYFKKTRNLDIAHSWMHLATIYLIITVLSNLGGWFPGYLMKLRLERHARSEDRYVHFCPLRSPNFVCHPCQRLGRSLLDWAGRIRAPGVVGESLLHGLRYVPKACGWVSDRLRQRRRLNSRDDFPHFLRFHFGQVHRRRQCHGRLQCLICYLCLCLPGGVWA